MWTSRKSPSHSRNVEIRNSFRTDFSPTRSLPSRARYASSGSRKSDRAHAGQVRDDARTRCSSRPHSSTRGQPRISPRRRSKSGRSAGSTPAPRPKKRNSLGAKASALPEPRIRAINVVPLRFRPPTNTGGATGGMRANLARATAGAAPDPAQEPLRLRRDRHIPVARVDEDDRPLRGLELQIRGVCTSAVDERRVGEVDVSRHVVRLVLEPEVRGVELLRHLRQRETRHRLVPPAEDVVVVEAEPVAPRRPVRGGADYLDPTIAEPPEQLVEERPRIVEAEHALERDEVVVEAHLVAELLEALRARDQLVARPVRRRVQEEVRRAEPALVLEPRELERAVESQIDVVAEREVAVTARELAQRHDHTAAEAAEKARVLPVCEPPLDEWEEQAARERLLHFAEATGAADIVVPGEPSHKPRHLHDSRTRCCDHSRHVRDLRDRRARAASGGRDRRADGGRARPPRPGRGR